MKYRRGKAAFLKVTQGNQNSTAVFRKCSPPQPDVSRMRAIHATVVSTPDFAPVNKAVSPCHAFMDIFVRIAAYANRRNCQCVISRRGRSLRLRGKGSSRAFAHQSLSYPGYQSEWGDHSDYASRETTKQGAEPNRWPWDDWWQVLRLRTRLNQDSTVDLVFKRRSLHLALQARSITTVTW
jgi:hypothetical protein